MHPIRHITHPLTHQPHKQRPRTSHLLQTHIHHPPRSLLLIHPDGVHTPPQINHLNPTPKIPQRLIKTLPHTTHQHITLTMKITERRRHKHRHNRHYDPPSVD